MSNTDKVALVTGASSGFGEAIAKELGAEGYGVLAAGRNEARTRGVVEEIAAAGGTAEAWLGDLTASGACSDLIAACRERFGRLDVLVNSAGVFYPALAEDTSEEEWDETVAVNLTAVFMLSRAALPLLRESGGGAIVNIASDWGLMGGRLGAAYCASKGGVVLMTKAMARPREHPGQRGLPDQFPDADDRGRVPPPRRRPGDRPRRRGGGDPAGPSRAPGGARQAGRLSRL
jgi:NAD(P)-dependent dehydrogenase (short-subunit alcohol dehydrogenase family)